VSFPIELIELDVFLLYVFSFHNSMLCLFQLVGHVGFDVGP
jgi:hypothetical protein